MKSEPIELVSVAIVAYNEASCIKDVLGDLLLQDYPHEKIEILLIDSASSDGTRACMDAFASDALASGFERVVVLDNEKRILPAGCNVALRAFSGDVLVRLDAHSRIPSDFVRQNVAVLDEGEFVCGGPRPVVASPDTPWSRTLLLAEESAFGSSIADYRSTSEKEYVSAVFHAAFRREVLECVGLYDERLVRTEDNDYFYRVRQNGYKIRFDRRVHSQQIARSTARGMLRQKYGNGYWIGRTLHIQPRCFRPYHFAPFVFVLGILLLLAVGALTTWLPFAMCGGLYLTVCVVLSVFAVGKAPKRTIQMLALPLVFVSIHVSYGIGTLFGLAGGVFDGR